MKHKAMQLIMEVDAKCIGIGNGPYVTLQVVDGDMQGTLELSSNSDDIDSLFGLGLCYELELRCHASNDPHNAWPVTKVVNDEYLDALEDVAEIAEHLVALSQLTGAGWVPTDDFRELQRQVDQLLRVKGSSSNDIKGNHPSNTSRQVEPRIPTWRGGDYS